MVIDSPVLSRLGWDHLWRDSFAITAATVAVGTIPARVTRTAASVLTVASEGGTWDVIRGAQLLTDPPPGGVTTGDWVAVDEQTAHAALPRRTALVRRAAGRATLAQAVAANIDIVFIAAPLGTTLSLRRVERSLAIAWSSGARPVVLLTKADLCADVNAEVRAVQTVAAGATVLAVSIDGTGVSEVRRSLRPGAAGAIIGPSGAGKSTLINALLVDGDLATAPVRSDGRGRHTTSHRELLEIAGGALLIDTPGMREMGMWAAQEGIEWVFGDILELATRCRFSDCAHAGEPGCAVGEAAVDDPGVLVRLDSLRKLEREQRHQERMSEARLRTEARRRIIKREGRAAWEDEG